MKAAPADQRRLLDIAELDARMRQADRQRLHPADAPRIKELASERHVLMQELSRLLGVRDDLRTELARIESDVAVVDVRAKRDAARLAASTNAKDAVGLESEIAALDRRKRDLEDGELVVMERLEQADADIDAQQASIAESEATSSRLDTASRGDVSDATSRYDAAARDRAAIAEGLPPELLAFFERAAADSVGAALLRRSTCEGCGMLLPSTTLSAIRQAADDEVFTCPECECILVRTEESGL